MLWRNWLDTTYQQIDSHSIFLSDKVRVSSTMPMIKPPSRDEVLKLFADLSWHGDRYIPFEWNKREIDFSRRLIRTQVLIDSGGLNNPTSDFGKPHATDYHEIVNRARTPEGSFTRWLCYQPEMAAVLRRDEHQLVHVPEQRNRLWLINYQKYGKDNVWLVFHLLNHYSVLKQSIKLP